MLISKELGAQLRKCQLCESLKVDGMVFLIAGIGTDTAEGTRFLLVKENEKTIHSYILCDKSFDSPNSSFLMFWASENHVHKGSEIAYIYVCGYKGKLYDPNDSRVFNFHWEIPQDFIIDFSLLAANIVTELHQLCEDGAWHCPTFHKFDQKNMKFISNL